MDDLVVEAEIHDEHIMVVMHHRHYEYQQFLGRNAAKDFAKYLHEVADEILEHSKNEEVIL